MPRNQHISNGNDESNRRQTHLATETAANKEKHRWTTKC